jgi:outer membrane protein TolC
LAAQRQQHGIAAAKVVIADTYPFNPVLENRIQWANGPADAAVTNSVPVEHILLWEFEFRHQRQFRRQGAAAALTRTDWEIAYQEQTLAVDVIRKYAGVIYRQEKLRLLDETLRLNERLVEDVRRLMNSPASKLRPDDLILAEAAVIETKDSVAAGQESLVAARQELFAVVSGAFDLEGPFAPPPWTWNAAAMEEMALARRADLHAREMAVAEAYANVGLTRANRFGNPTIGPAFTYDPTRISMIGAQINVPLPFNTRRGESPAKRGDGAGQIGRRGESGGVPAQQSAAGPPAEGGEHGESLQGRQRRFAEAHRIASYASEIARQLSRRTLVGPPSAGGGPGRHG